MELATTDTASGPVALAVVCDGVSSSDRADEASLAAAQAAIRVLLAAVDADEDLLQASVEAVRSAREAVVSLAGSSREGPSATLVSAVVDSDGVTVCWLGDSRAYWLGDVPGPLVPGPAGPGSPVPSTPVPSTPVPSMPVPSSAGPGSTVPNMPVPHTQVANAAVPGSTAQRLTRDDSLAEEMVAAGLLAEDDALDSPQAHVVTRWIGTEPDKSPPHVIRFEPPGPGVLLLCSDGLWNYRPEAAGLAELALPDALANPLGAAGALVTFALESGGTDNITAVLVPFPPCEKS